MKTAKTLAYLLSFAFLACLLASFNLYAWNESATPDRHIASQSLSESASVSGKIMRTQDDGNEPCCYNAPGNPGIDAPGNKTIPVAQDDANEPCCYNAPHDPMPSIDGDARVLTAQDDGNEPCCYNTPGNPGIDAPEDPIILVAQDDANEPCCYTAYYGASLQIQDPDQVRLSSNWQRPNAAVALYPFAPAVPCAATLTASSAGDDERSAFILTRDRSGLKQS